MSSIRPHKGQWRAWVNRGGKRRTKVCRTRAEAEAWATRTDAALQTVAGVGEGKDRLHRVIDAYAAALPPARASEKKRLTRLKGELPDLPVGKLTTPVLADWRDRRLQQVKPASVRRDMTTLRGVLEWARRERKLIAANPLADVGKPPAPPPRSRLIQQHEVDALVAALHYAEDLPVVTKGQQVAVMFLLAIETAMRAGEILAATVRGNVAYLAKTKNGDAREVPLSKRAVELFGLLPTEPSARVAAGTRDALFRKARAAAGLAGFTFHDSRALALTRLARKVDVLTLARIVGHRDPRSLMVYYRESAADIASRLG